MKRTRLPSWHTHKKVSRRTARQDSGVAAMVGPLRLAPTLPPAADGLADGEVHMVFPRSGPGRPIRALLAGRGDMEFAIANVSEGGARSAVHKPSGAAEAVRVEALHLRHGGHQDRSFPAVRRHIRSQAALSSQPVQETLQDAATTRQRVSGASLDLLATTSQAERRF